MKTRRENVIYSLNANDVQNVSKRVLNRQLTKGEIEVIQDSIGNYIDWVQAIENAIRWHIPQ